MFRGLFQNPFSRFLILSSILYLSWYFTYEFYLKDQTLLNEYVIDHIVRSSEAILRFMGYDLNYYDDGNLRVRLGILGSGGVVIGAPCDGIVLLALFTVFMISYAGPLKHKVWYLPMGLLVIHWLNIGRVVALSIIVATSREWFTFNHDYTFTLLVYAVVFLLWYIWIIKFSGKK